MSDRTCSIDGCDAPHNARGWCQRHYNRWRYHGDALYEPSYLNKGQACSVEGCDRPAFTGGLCNKHDGRMRRTGSTAIPKSFRNRRAPAGQAWCGRCQTYKPVQDFYKNRSTKTGRSGYCIPCWKQQAQRRKERARHDAWLDRRTYQYRAKLAGVDRERYTRLEIAERDGWKCQLCGKRIDRTLRWPHPHSLTIDHIVPLKPAEGGPAGLDVKSNVQAAHARCNVAKKNRGRDQLRLF